LLKERLIPGGGGGGLISNFWGKIVFSPFLTHFYQKTQGPFLVKHVHKRAKPTFTGKLGINNPPPPLE